MKTPLEAFFGFNGLWKTPRKIEGSDSRQRAKIEGSDSCFVFCHLSGPAIFSKQGVK